MQRPRSALELEQLAGRVTITIPEAARLLGIGRTAAYEAANARTALSAPPRPDRCTLPWLVNWLEGR